jgi:hypothetical protein
MHVRLRNYLAGQLGPEVAEEAIAWMNSLASSWSVFDAKQHLNSIERRLELVALRLETIEYRLDAWRNFTNRRV